MSRYHVILPAAGSGSRMGGQVPKQYLSLLDQPLIHHTLEVFCSHPEIDAVHVVLSPEDRDWARYETAHFGDKLNVLHCGGETRAESVLNGLQAIADRAQHNDWVLVHDAARPCLTHVLLDRLIAELANDEVGGLLAVPVADTIKREGADGRVAKTELREGLWRAQTPQMFRYALLVEALQHIATIQPTDEAQAVEYLGHAPKLVMGDGHNIKVTYPEDLAMAAAILRS